MLIRTPGGSWERPTVTSYTDEAALETMLLDSPELLPGGDGSPLAVVSQLYVPGTGPMDLFAVSLTGELTVVEVKLRANPEIRRSVVGQTLAYASGIWRMSYAELDEAFRARAGKSLVEVLAGRADALGGDFDPESLRETVTRNLASGAMRLVIAVDAITDELKRIIEFLNDRTRPEFEVLALELTYMGQEGVEVLVPAVYGQEGIRRKATEGSRRRWNEQELLSAIADHSGPVAAEVLTAVYEHGRSHPLFSRWYWGEGAHPSVTAWFSTHGIDVPVWSISTAPEGRSVLAMNFDWIHRRGAGLPIEAVERLAERLRVLPGVTPLYAGLAVRGYAKRPSIPEASLTAPGAKDVIVEALDELLGDQG
ncbi:hypothetical protein [Blastococcus tunisiensis]|uniref:Uncharacterized protein n=1 Tax=Blastococcus tunisiensis TaxID=1798228 RepID=A0A1I2B8I9_9ACTN|nr:hypothetical protein [Blastococcus sp. DSM 46838]SFE52474.1 hypothetical protein SAMN05216574_10487 [Blastococcus sp. DSM 46838]